MVGAVQKTFKPLPYPAARAFAVIGSAFMFFFIAALLGGALSAALAPATLQAEHAAWMLALGLLCSAFFAGQGGSIGLLDAYSQGRVALPVSTGSAPGVAGAAGSPPLTAAEAGAALLVAARVADPSYAAANPWAVALRCAAWLGLPLGALGFGAVYAFWPRGLPREQFAWLFALSSAALGGGIVAALTGRPFLREAGLAKPQRAFAGSHAAYLWRRQVLPQIAINVFINGWVGLAIAPARLAEPDPRVPRELVLADAGGTALVLAIAIAAGVHTYARFDLRWGVTRGSAGKAPHWALRLLALLGSAVAVALLVQVLFALTGWDAVGLYGFVIGRGLACGAYSGWVAYLVARWNQLEPRGGALNSSADRAAA